MIKKNSTIYFNSQIAINLFTAFGRGDINSVLIISLPGSGKTLLTVDFYLWVSAMCQRNWFMRNHIKLVLVSFSANVFVEQMSNSIDIGYIPINTYLAEPTPEEKRGSQKLVYLQMMCYKKFAFQVLTIIKEEHYNAYKRTNRRRDPIKVILEAQEKGYIKINMDAVHEFDNSILVFDEGHKLQNGEYINFYGDVAFILKHFALGVYIVFVSATVFNSKATELAAIQSLLLDDPLPFEECFDENGELIADYEEKIMTRFNDRIIYSGKIDERYTPKHIFMGEIMHATIGGKLYTIDPTRKYVKLQMSDAMKKHHFATQHMQLDALLFTAEVTPGQMVYNRETMRHAMMHNMVELNQMGLFPCLE